MEILLNQYGKNITDVLNKHSYSAQSLGQNLEQKNFFEEFDDTAADLLANVKSFARRKLNCGEMNEDRCSYISLLTRHHIMIFTCS